jgi:putative ABC transport system substrate-binding protein
MRQRGVAPSLLTTALGVVLAAAALAQDPAPVKRIGLLAHAPGVVTEGFLRGLRARGHVEGRDVAVEARFSHGDLERFPELAAELVRRKVDVIAVVGAVTARAAERATSSIPIVFAVVVDPVADGVVSDLQRPEANATGVTTFDPQQSRIQLELLEEAVPGLRRVAILGDRGVSEFLARDSERHARELGLEPLILRVAGPAPDLEGALASAKRQGAGALLVLEEPITGIHQKEIAELAARYRLPSIFSRDRAEAGGLMAYGTSITEGARRMATYVDRILGGARPGDLPVERVAGHELIVNVGTAQKIGLSIPPRILGRADRIIR